MGYSCKNDNIWWQVQNLLSLSLPKHSDPRPHPGGDRESPLARAWTLGAEGRNGTEMAAGEAGDGWFWKLPIDWRVPSATPSATWKKTLCLPDDAKIHTE